jgi:hypothetical protein
MEKKVSFSGKLITAGPVVKTTEQTLVAVDAQVGEVSYQPACNDGQLHTAGTQNQTSREIRGEGINRTPIMLPDQFNGMSGPTGAVLQSTIQ